MRRARGFTLVEVLVVMVIIGVLAGAVSLSGAARGDGYVLREEAERFAAVLRLLADEAVQGNREYGVRINTQGYGMRAYDARDGRWRLQPDWSPRQLPQGMQLSLSVEGTPVALADADADADGGADAHPPQIVLSSSAQSTAFSATLTATDKPSLAYRITADGFNDPQVQLVSSQ